MSTAAERAKAEATAGDGTVTVEFRDHTYLVLPVRDWDKAAIASMRESDYDSWARQSMVKESYARWNNDLRTMRDAMEFVAEWSKVTGQDAGESPASPPS